MTTITDGVNSTGFTNDEATEALLGRWKDADKLSNTDEGKTSKEPRTEDEEDDDLDFLEDEGDENADTDEDDNDEGSDEDQSDSEDDTNALEATDDHKVKITVDGKEETVTVKELKRLFGQEASLTRKSQEVAAARKAAEAEAERYVAVSEKLLAKAEARFAPFENIDWLVAQQKLTPDEFAALRAEAKDAYDEINFLKNEANEVIKEVQATRSAELAAAAQESIKVLERDIPGWNRDVYSKVCQYAVEGGMDAEVVSKIIDPSAIKFLHKAMRYDELKAKAAQKKSKPKGAPSKVVRSSNSSPTRIGKSEKGANSIDRLRKTGSRDDAVEALMGRWAAAADDS